jgi:hypothetical protein
MEAALPVGPASRAAMIEDSGLLALALFWVVINLGVLLPRAARFGKRLGLDPAAGPGGERAASPRPAPGDGTQAARFIAPYRNCDGTARRTDYDTASTIGTTPPAPPPPLTPARPR